jgi:hypothetical protein
MNEYLRYGTRVSTASRVLLMEFNDNDDVGEFHAA